MEFPKVSVIIPVYNGENYLKDAIESVLSQTYKNIEIIVVDDGSIDHTENIVKIYKEKVIYIKKENGGVSTALNLGIKHMTGDYFAWLSHDDIMDKEKIKLQIESILKSGDKNKISIANYRYFNENSKTFTYTDFERFFTKDIIQNSVFPLFWFELHFSCILFHKSYFSRIGLFDEELKTAQDNDFIFRLLKNNKTVFLDEVVSTVRIHQNSSTNRENIRLNKENSRLYMDMANKLTEKEIGMFCKYKSAFFCKIAGIAKSMGETNLNKVEEKIEKYAYLCDDVDITKKVKYIIFGAGQYGIRLKYEMNYRRLNVVCFADNDKLKQDTVIDDSDCFSLEKAIKKYPDAKIVIAQKLCTNAQKQLEDMGIKDYYLKLDMDSLLFNLNPKKKLK